MTDISRWAELVVPVRLRVRDPATGEWLNHPGGRAVFAQYIQVPLNGYQIGNLLGALKRSENTGDWYDEILAILATAMDKAGLKEVSSNMHESFTLDQVISGELGEP